MALPTKTFAGFVNDMVATWAAYLGFQPTLQKGDALYALMQTISSQLLFIQSLVYLVNQVARAQTSADDALDSFYAQFDFSRLPATTATGQATFSKFTPAASPVLIPVGAPSGSPTVVQTPGGAVAYNVVADTAQPTWNAALNAYVLAVGQTSLTATIQAKVAGSAANVGAGQINQIASSLAGIDAVTNGAPITNGLDAETDAAYNARFPLYLNSLAKATQAAIVSAILGVQQGIDYNLLENENTAGIAAPGQFVAVVDDGSGAPPASLISSVQAAINAVRGFTILATAKAVTEVILSISLSVRIASGYLPGSVTAAVQAAILPVVNDTPIGGVDGILVYISAIEAAAASVPGVVSVQPRYTTINGANADYAGTGFQDAKTTLGDITVGTY